MKLFQSYKVAPEHAGLLVEQYLKQVLHYSGRKIQKLTRRQGIVLNGKAVFLQKPLKSNDILRVLVIEDTSYGVQAEPGTIEILYEDDYLLVLNKPPYQLVHPAGQTTSGTLANHLAHHFAGRGVVCTVRAVHRLDRETSGCVIFAKDARSQSLLEQQLKRRTLKRSYLALVTGNINPPAGTINASIGHHPSLPNRRAVQASGDEAITYYQTVCSFAEASLVELTLDTGRTHQIRVHLAHLGHPVIGDRMYGTCSGYISRQALHAVSVSFEHLGDKSRITVNAPLPIDMARSIELNKSV
ncbi:MAG: RluA family pseudouridine synthase [Sporomusa sp.]